MQGRDYYRSERFIHDDLARSASALVEQVRKDWRKDRKVESMAFSWPARTIKADGGGKINHFVVMAIPQDMDEAGRLEALKRMVARTEAYAIALTERRGDELRVLFESHHGARAWVIPLKRHGDLLVPGPTQVRDNMECLGLLWSPHQGQS